MSIKKIIKNLMKLGNVSQSIVPVPNFFLDKSEKNLETFKISNKKSSYYRDRDLFQKINDLNLNHNQRSSKRKSEEENKEKYIPIYNRTFYPNNANLKNTYFPNIIDSSKTKTIYPESGYQKFADYKNKTNYNKFFNPDLREQIMHDTKNLIDRINANYQINKWDEFDHRTTFNRFYQTAYSPITDVINTDGDIKEEFSNTLRDKAISLKTINSRTKSALNDLMDKKQMKEELEKKIKNELSNKSKEQFLDEMLETNKTNLLNLQYNNDEPFEYNKKDKKFIKDNEYITKGINKTELYKDFPSKTRMEYDKKLINPRKKLNKMINENLLVQKGKYNYNERELYNCQNEMWIRPLHKDAYYVSK
jgi:hypothetical protein